MCSSFKWMKTEVFGFSLWSIVFCMFDFHSTIISHKVDHFCKYTHEPPHFPQGPVLILWYSNHFFLKECQHVCGWALLRLLRGLRLPFLRLPMCVACDLSSSPRSRLLILLNPASLASFADSLCCWFALHCIMTFAARREGCHGDFTVTGRDAWVEVNL